MKKTVIKYIERVLKKYAQRLIKRHNPFIIAVTGSVGKTSAKEAISSILKEAHPGDVRATSGNLNAEIGIPLTILGYNDLPTKWSWPFFLVLAFFKSLSKTYPNYLILEVGIEHPGDIRYFGTIFKPDIAIITAATAAHTANFSSVTSMQREKTSITNILKDSGFLIMNNDDDFLSKEKIDNSFTYSIKSPSYFKAENINVEISGNSYSVARKGFKKIIIKSKKCGRHNIYSELSAIAVASLMKIDDQKIIRGINKINPMPGRSNIINGIKNTIIIDDTYNSNPSSAKAALDLLAEIGAKKRKVAILGNMNELGKIEKDSHIKIGKYARSRTDLSIFIGQNAKIMKDSYNDDKRSIAFKNKEEIFTKLSNLIIEGDIILVKASQNNNYFEEIVKFLMRDKSRAKELLVRQSRYWMKKK